MLKITREEMKSMTIVKKEVPPMGQLPIDNGNR